MATYFHGSSDIQAADGLQTLYLMNPNYIGYSDTQQPSAANMLFLNPSTLQNMPLQNQHLVGIPLPTNSDDQNRSSLHEMPPPRFHYNLWASTDQSPPQIPTAPLGLRRPDVVSPTQQGLSLSLSPHQPAYRPVPDIQVQQPPQVQAISPPGSGDDMRVSGGSSSTASAVSNGISGMQSVLLGSKYLKAAQQLLDEVANVGKGIKADSGEGNKELRGKVNAASTGDAPSGGESSAKRGPDHLSTAQRQELQMKKAKLVNMLDEVEQRYRQYHQQMEMVVCSFDQAAGQGSAKSYTALALQTISKQFRCLKEAISAQIKGTSSSLGEEDQWSGGGGKVEGSRLRFVDHQRALQQLGMIHHNAWRPQRGLPERAVSVLRAWLFEHFLHPYPKDSDKHMLAKQTGLTRSQVSNWFINARVRLWKPMVEEMYLEETKDHQENNGTQENTSKNEAGSQEGGATGIVQSKQLQSKQEKSTGQNASPPELSNSNSTMSTTPMGGSLQVQAGFNLIGSSEIEGMVVQRTSPKKPRSYDIQSSPSSILSMDMEMKPGSGGTSREIRDAVYPGALTNGNAFGAYPIGDLGRFNPEQLAPRFHMHGGGNGVSLTLGLPHCENLSLSAGHQSYLSNPNVQLGRRLEMGTGPQPDFCGINTAQPSHSNTAYESIDIQNRKRFAAQLLPADFVA